ncbi:hypothetical protein XA68_11901 [Ophiocordyceps unilateralis]|uniref:Uncharacterized protein n=1 Tax=Ophiocordyceps unilateralis TaxID=268505 RepID=A0A2A9PFV9_OPHUN|nr:hypothetical protein XA68_11901 [Ophiocordyceps unilateralis]
MFMGSAIFEGALRIDLLRIYSFYRTVDDLVDEAPDRDAARLAIKQCSKAIRIRFGPQGGHSREWKHVNGFQGEEIPPSLCSSVAQLPASRLAPEPISYLLAGF